MQYMMWYIERSNGVLFSDIPNQKLISNECVSYVRSLFELAYKQTHYTHEFFLCLFCNPVRAHRSLSSSGLLLMLMLMRSTCMMRLYTAIKENIGLVWKGSANTQRGMRWDGDDGRVHTHLMMCAMCVWESGSGQTSGTIAHHVGSIR